MIIALAWAFKDDDHVQEMATWQKRLSKADFLKLSKSQRERYIKLYPHSSHRFLMGKGDPDNVEGGQQMKKAAPVGRDRFMSEDEIQEKRRKRAEHLDTRKEIADFNKSNVAVINPQSLQALDHVKDSHLREASDGIQKNKTEIAKAVQQQQKKLPKMYGKGLQATRDLVSGETHPDDMSTTQKHAMHRVLGGIATMALLGAGVMACGMAAAPLGVLMGATLFNMWAGSKHGKNLRDDIDELRQAREKRRREERKLQNQAVASNDQDGDLFTPHEDESMSDADTINLILDHVTDLLKYHSVKDFQEHRDEMFASASNAPDFRDLEYILRFANCANFQALGKGIAFECAGGQPSLEKLFRRMGYMVSASEQGEQRALHFDNGKGRATLGNCDKGFYIRYDGDFDYRTVL
uniref:Uncharacterized protein n=1 Tax=Pseudomonas phage HRDY3 TaxID=3236930 RepID=A0AB39CEF2_9VIRU